MLRSGNLSSQFLLSLIECIRDRLYWQAVQALKSDLSEIRSSSSLAKLKGMLYVKRWRSIQGQCQEEVAPAQNFSLREE